MSNINYELIAFKAISEFTKELSQNFTTKDKNHSLKLYEHLLNKTTLSHDKAIKKHVDAFRIFCIDNRDAIKNKNISLLKNKKVYYSTRVFIDFSTIFKESDKDTANIIWKHLLTISALVDPAGKAKDILKSSSGTKEADFLNNIIDKVESSVNPNSNPLEAISSIMTSGVFNDLITGMNNGIQNGELDLGKLMGTVQTMCSTLSNDIGSDNTMDNPMNMLNSLMSSMNTGKASSESAPGIPDLTSLLGPMLTTLNNNSLPTNLNEKINSPNTNMSTITELSSTSEHSSLSSVNNDLD
jgi:hypothetical protein